jgi:hypothetical protein
MAWANGKQSRWREISAVFRAGGHKSGYGAQRQGYTRMAMKDAMDELVQKYSRQGHPSAEELIAAQGLTFPRDPQDLLGNWLLAPIMP